MGLFSKKKWEVPPEVKERGIAEAAKMGRDGALMFFGSSTDETRGPTCVRLRDDKEWGERVKQNTCAESRQRLAKIKRNHLSRLTEEEAQAFTEAYLTTFDQCVKEIAEEYDSGHQP
jgi:hypothetical protein